MSKAFISYSHKDEKALDRLHTHLAMLSRENLITAWYDREILAGDDIAHEISSKLRDTDLFLPLVSPDFLGSNYCYEQEMGNALKRHEDGTLRVIPIILEPCDWKTSPLGKLKALPKDGKPISLWTNENVAYLDVVTELRRLIGALEGNLQGGPPKTRQEPVSNQTSLQSRRYRIKKEFDSIDRDEFRRQAFKIIEEYFRRSVDELNEIGDPIRAHFEKMGSGAFSCTVLNKAARNKEAHITIRNGDDGLFGDAITYSFSRRNSNSANGFIRVEANEYELYLKADELSFHRPNNSGPMSSEQSADALWHEFISHAGIEHE
jgi:TIR domain